MEIKEYELPGLCHCAGVSIFEPGEAMKLVGRGSTSVAAVRALLLQLDMVQYTLTAVGAATPERWSEIQRAKSLASAAMDGAA